MSIPNIFHGSKKQSDMLTKPVLVLFVIITFLTSCKQKEDAENDINNYTNAVISSSISTSEASSKLHLNSLKEKLFQLRYKELAEKLKPKADSSIALASIISEFLDLQISEIKNKGKLDENDRLFEKLKDYEVKILKIDSNLNEIFHVAILLIDTSSGFKNMDKERFENHFIKGVSKNELIIFLNSLKANIKHNECNMVEYFDLSCGFILDCYYSRFEPMVTQNSIHFKSNETLEIKAGVASFSMASLPKFNIDGKDVQIDDVGVAWYSRKVSKAKGKHTIPVKISWIKPNGETSFLSKDLIYYVE